MRESPSIDSENERLDGPREPIWELLSMSPLFQIPVRVGDCLCKALLDSGACQNFISEELTEKLHLKRHPLKQPFVARAANGHLLRVDSYARVSLRMANAFLRIHFRIVAMHPNLILGNPFLKKYNPTIDWQKQIMEFDHRAHHVVVDSLTPPTPLCLSDSADSPGPVESDDSLPLEVRE